MKATGRAESPASIVRDARPASQPAAVGLTSAEAYAARHGRVDQNVFTYAVPRALLARLGIKLLSGTGYAVLIVVFFASILIPILAIGALTGTLGWVDRNRGVDRG